MKKILICGLFLSFVLNTIAWAEASKVVSPSFDCTKAKTRVEKLICGSKELSDIDLKLSFIYKNALKHSSDKSILIKNQSNWRKTVREACDNVPSMLSAYKTRIIELQKMSYESFSIEGEKLLPMNADAGSAIRKYEVTVTKLEYGDCENFQGKEIDLEDSGNGGYWIVMTSDMCGWGAHAARLWILKDDSNGYKVLFTTGGSGMKIYHKRSHGLREFEITDSSAGYYSEEGYVYNGKEYVVGHKRYVDFLDPKSCSDSKNRDVCP